MTTSMIIQLRSADDITNLLVAFGTNLNIGSYGCSNVYKRS